jgi:hypothetical protein
MRQTCKIAIQVMALGILGVNAQAVSIVPGAYAGRYSVVGVTGYQSGAASLTLAAGTYFVDNGTAIGGSTFDFTVDGLGAVTCSTPAATCSGSAITFNGVSIAIASQSYTGRYIVSSYSPNVMTGDQSITLLPGLSYSLDNHTLIGGSAFTFSLDALGNITTGSPAAFGNGASLIFNTVPVAIDPLGYAGRYFLMSFYPTSFTGPQTLNLLPGLVYAVDNASLIGSSGFQFSVDSSGSVASSSQAASANGSVLTFSGVSVHVDPGAYTGAYNLGGYANLSGATNVVLIPTLGVGLIAGAQIGVVTPDLCDVTPPVLFSFTFSVTADGPGCGPVYTATVEPPIKSNGSSVFKVGRGVVPVKFALAANNAATCQLPQAFLSLIRTSGSVPGPVNESDYLQPSDNGSTFRLGNCQYVYNLGMGSLAAGQYLVQISINGAVVGSAAFGLD